MKYIDIHCHLNHSDFDLDIDEVINRAREKEIGMIVIGNDFESSKKAIKIAEGKTMGENNDIWATIGVHPTDINNEQFDFDSYSNIARNEKVIGIGECGLDYFRDGFKDRSYQEEIFVKQIDIANNTKKPLMLHLRNGMGSDENAYKDAILLLKKHSQVHGNIHFFAGNWEEAKQFLDLGFRLSFTGVISFARNYDEIIKNIPLNMIMAETDAPFVAPIPYRGNRNEPSYIKEIIKIIASIKGEDFEKVSNHLIDNARKLFLI